MMNLALCLYSAHRVRLRQLEIVGDAWGNGWVRPRGVECARLAVLNLRAITWTRQSGGNRDLGVASFPLVLQHLDELVELEVIHYQLGF